MSVGFEQIRFRSDRNVFSAWVDVVVVHDENAQRVVTHGAAATRS
jgi:hypothetical protein